MGSRAVGIVSTIALGLILLPICLGWILDIFEVIHPAWRYEWPDFSMLRRTALFGRVGGGAVQMAYWPVMAILLARPVRGA